MSREENEGEVGWATVIDGLNEVSRKIYFLLLEHSRALGLFDDFDAGETTVSALRERLGVPVEVEHRFRVALRGLRAIGVLELEGEKLRLCHVEPESGPIDDGLISAVFGPAIGAYLKIYHERRLFDPGFALTFAGEQSALWEGLLNAPINTVGGDQAVTWIGKPGGRVLELAFGPGRTIRQLVERIGEGGEVEGVDSSRYYVERARDTYRESPSVHLREADVNEGLTYFENSAFDGVMFMGALQFVKDPPSLFHELSRVLRLRGKLVLGAFHTDKPCFANPALHMHMNLFDPPAFEYPVERVKHWLWEAGFETNISVEFGSYCSLYAEKMPEVLSSSRR